MDKKSAVATTALPIQGGQDSQERLQSCAHVPYVCHQDYKFNSFEAKCHFTLNQLHKDWKTNGLRTSPICIPAAMEVHEKWFIRTLDPNAIDYNERVVNNRLGKVRGDNAERIVHQAFQRSNIGGILIQGVDYGTMWDVLKKSSDLSADLKQLLKPSNSGGMDMFEIDFLFFHPAGGIFVMECKAFEDSKNSPIKECKDALKQAERSRERLLSVFKIFTGADFPLDLIHVVLCLPNVKRKSSITGMEHIDILDAQELKDILLFHIFWQTLIEKYSKYSANYFENLHVSCLLALTFGFRSAKFISVASNSLEIFRKIDSQESSKFKKAQFDFGNKVIFLNSEQLIAYNIAKNGQNMLLFGPPGSGKTLLIQLLAKEASEKEGKGRVVVLLAYEELAIMYENFFKANRENQKREIVINPSRAELRRSLSSDSFDDIFADEVVYGGWIPRENRPNGQIFVGITAGRRYEKSRVSFVKEKLKGELINAAFCLFELKSVMRNTGKICQYYNQFELVSDSKIVIGHNIEGSDVIEITTSDTKSAVIAILNRIKQYLGKNEGSSRRDRTNFFCLPTDIAVLVAHQPVCSQINRIKKALKEAGIETGSISEQIAARRRNENPIVAVDCSANVLSFEWPIVFVVNASQCPYSKNIASPIVSFSRAVSSLIVVNTRECKYPYFLFFCKAIFSYIAFNFFRRQDLCQYNYLIGEINLNQSRKFMFQLFFWLSWAITFLGIPLLLIFCLHTVRPHYHDVCCTAGDTIFISMILIIVLLCFISAVVSYKNYKKCTAILVDLLIILSFSTFIAFFYSEIGIGYEVGMIIISLLCSLIFYITIGVWKLGALQRDWTVLYFATYNCSKQDFFLFSPFWHGLVVLLTFAWIALFFITCSYSTSLYIVLCFAPGLLSTFQLSLRPKQVKSILIQP